MPIIKAPDNNRRRPRRPIRDFGPAIGGTLAGTGNEIQNVGRQLTAAGQAYFKEAEELEANREYTKALVEATVEFNQQYGERINQTTDEDKNPTYGTLTDDVSRFGQSTMSKFLNKIQNPKARIKFERSFGRYVGNKQISSFSVARKQQLDIGRTSLLDAIDTQMGGALSDDPANINHHRAVLEEMIDDGLSSGMLSSSEHRKLKNKTMDDLNLRVYSTFAKKNPEASLEFFKASSAADLGVDEDIREKIIEAAESEVRSSKRAAKQAEREQSAAERRQQNKVHDELFLDIVEGKDNETSIRQAFHEGQITTKHKALLLQKLKNANKDKKTKATSFKSIDDSLAGGRRITESAARVGQHYGEAVVNLLEAGEQATLAQKASVGARYTTPVKPLQRELEFAVMSGDGSQKIDALQAYRFLKENGSRAIDGMDRKARAVLDFADNMTQSTNMPAAAAMSLAKERVLDANDLEIKARNVEFRKIKQFKHDDLEETIKDMYDIDSFLGFGGSDLPAGMRQRTLGLLQEAYKLTGDPEAAKSLVKSWTDNITGSSKINNGKEFMLMPPEKVYPGVSHETLRKDLVSDVQAMVPGVDADAIKIEADELTRTGTPTYQVYVERDLGDGTTIKEPLLDKNADPVRWGYSEESKQEPVQGEAPARETDPELVAFAREQRQKRIKSQAKLEAAFPLSSSKKLAVQEIDKAAGIAGIDSKDAAAIAKVESGLNPNAKAKKSSASGLFQFINSTWRSMVRKYGKKFGIKLEDKNDPKANAIMGALFIRDNNKILARSIGREPNIRESYLAHFSGVGRAAKVIKALDRNPNAPVGTVFSTREIRANRSILKGTIKQSFDRLTNKVVKARRSFS